VLRSQIEAGAQQMSYKEQCCALISIKMRNGNRKVEGSQRSPRQREIRGGLRLPSVMISFIQIPARRSSKPTIRQHRTILLKTNKVHQYLPGQRRG